jgi:hypothetical protein
MFIYERRCFCNFEKYLFKEEKSIDMSKGIAIETILYLLLGIIVVGIIIYLVYTYTTGGQLNEQQCRSKVISWCTGCSVANWADVSSKDATSDVGQCITNYFSSGNFGSNWPVTCNATSGGTIGETKTFCQAFL